MVAALRGGVYVIHTYIVLQHHVGLHAFQAPIIETGFKTNKVINNFIHWELKENREFVLVSVWTE